MNDFDTSNFDLEQASGGRNKIILDDLGNPSVMVAVPAFKISDVIDNGSDEWDPAFIITENDKKYLIPVIWASKYQNIVVNDRAYSLAGKTPTTNIDFDHAIEVCRNKGDGWHPITNATWLAVALWSKKNGTQPYGNNNYGSDIDKPWIHGEAATYDSDGRVNFIKTGSMGALSSHDGTDFGIMDLNGNEWEWTAGLRLNDGEINIIPNNNAAKYTCDMSVNSSEWKAILPDGTLVAPGTNGTLKFDYTATPAVNTSSFELATSITHKQPDDTAYGNKEFEKFTAHSGVNVPMILKTLGIFPADLEGYKGDHIWFKNNGERLLLCGGNWLHGAEAGVFNLNFNNPRTYFSHTIGFRSCYYDPASLIEIR